MHEVIHLADPALAPVNRPRLARYLELPSVAEIDPVTDAEIRRLDARRDELLSCWHRAVAIPVVSIDGSSIELMAHGPPVEATAAFGCTLRESSADALLIAAFTIGPRVDRIIKTHLARGEVYEAFVLKQWSATMAEQLRVELTRSLRGWAERQGRALLPYDGPGYNGWPLASLHPLLKVVYGPSDDEPRPVRATESGVLLPTNSMLIVHGVTCRREAIARSESFQDRLAQCHRCAMRSCRYRAAPVAVETGDLYEDVPS